MNSGFYIFITIVRAPSGLVTTSTTQPDSLQGEQEGGSEVLAVTEAAGGGEAPAGLHLNQQGSRPHSIIRLLPPANVHRDPALGRALPAERMWR